MPSVLPDRLKDYVDVKERIRLFLERYPDGRLVTDRVEIWQDDEVPRIVVKALAYRTPDDPHPGTGWSWMTLPGATPYTRGSELENTETSAWGRAIGSLGLGIDKSIASQQEVDAKAGDGKQAEEEPSISHSPDGSLIGTVTRGKVSPVDMQLRQDPKGPYIGFSLRQGVHRLQVVAVGPLADALAPLLEGLIDERVSVWGSVEMVPWRKGDREMPPYKRLQLERIVTDDWIMPAEAETTALFAEEELADAPAR